VPRRLGTRGGVAGERCQVERNGLHSTRSNRLEAGERVGPSLPRPTQDRVGLLLAWAAHPKQRDRSRVIGDKPIDRDRSKTSRCVGPPRAGHYGLHAHVEVTDAPTASVSLGSLRVIDHFSAKELSTPLSHVAHVLVCVQRRVNRAATRM
jgi:hypothetical protein